MLLSKEKKGFYSLQCKVWEYTLYKSPIEISLSFLGKNFEKNFYTINSYDACSGF